MRFSAELRNRRRQPRERAEYRYARGVQSRVEIVSPEEMERRMSEASLRAG